MAVRPAGDIPGIMGISERLFPSPNLPGKVARTKTLISSKPSTCISGTGNANHSRLARGKAGL